MVSFRNHKTMRVGSIPNVSVLETVHVHVERTIIVEVHVSNEDLCGMSPVTLLC
jgi:hypothetical protein